MVRYFVEVAYNGTHFHGWQVQSNALSVQQVLEEKLSTLLRVPIAIVGSGRTDTGVHASQQYFHFDHATPLETAAFLHRMNAFLPQEIALKSITKVNDDAHARFDASMRSYIYRIETRKNPFAHGFAYCYTHPLNVEKMNEAAIFLLGNHDFQAFSKVKTEVNNYFCELNRAVWEEGNESLIFHVSANRFLRGMVRAVVGTLLDVGAGRTTITEFQQILLSKDRRQAGRAVPPTGLYLSRVVYPAAIFAKR